MSLLKISNTILYRSYSISQAKICYMLPFSLSLSLYLMSETQSAWWLHFLTGSLSLSLCIPYSIAAEKTYFYFSIIFLATKQSSWLQLISLCFRFTILVILRLDLLYIHTFPIQSLQLGIFYMFIDESNCLVPIKT